MALVVSAGLFAAAARAAGDFMPQPAQAEFNAGQLAVNSSWSTAFRGVDDPRVRAAVRRLLTTWQERTGLTFAHTPEGDFAFASGDKAGAVLTIDCQASAAKLPVLGENETYVLEITPAAAVLRAPTSTGALRGLATLTQALRSDANGWFLPALKIQDQPRFPWRGLMIDVCRHWQPIEVLKRNLDGMALVKLNVLHLHLTEDQGFRIETKRVPQLYQRGSDGHFFTQAQIREIIAYAGERGIRVVPEFDMPGHATSWVAALPDIASAPGPYVIERRWGVFDPVLDPTNEQTYAMLAEFLAEMADLFPDPYLHIGGDENNGKQWNANPRIQAFIREHDLKDNAGLHAYFNQRIRDILQQHGKKLVGWDEILHPDLPKDSVVHSWRGVEGLAAAARQGYATILSNGYYIDLNFPAVDHYRNDPIPANTTLSAEEQSRILGGEATMWAEWVTPEIIDSRIWPRTAAIAERLWSPRDVTDVPDMYRRLAVVSHRLAEAGLRHERNRPEMLRRFGGDAANPELLAALATLVDAIEPVKRYERGQQQPEVTQLSPLTGLADIARPESDEAREFSGQVETYLSLPEPKQAEAAADLRATLAAWQQAAESIATQAPGAGARVNREAMPVASALRAVCVVGLDALSKREARKPRDAQWQQAAHRTLAAGTKPGGGVLLPMTTAIGKLVDAPDQP